jgi:nitrogen regulatory protein P-II 1
MKMIVAMIKPHKLEELKDALEAVGVVGMTVSDVKGHGRQKGQTELYRGSGYTMVFHPKIRVEVVVSDSVASEAVDAIVRACRTEEVGDGKVFVLPVEDAVRIRTGEHGDAAL